MKDKLKRLEDHVSALSENPNFIHHQWFVTHHLKLIEQLCNQLCDLYPQADRDQVMVLVWLHDLGKILGFEKLSREEETELAFKEGSRLMREFGFSDDFIDTAIENLSVFEQAKTRDLSKENIEVQIASSADGCSHIVMPFFFSSFWQDSPQMTFAELVAENQRKCRYDIERKITLPEAKKAFLDRAQYLMNYNSTDIGSVF